MGILQTDAFEFNTALCTLATPADCGRLFLDAIRPLGFEVFACGELDLNDRDRTVFYLIEWPESWREFYFSSGLIHSDPLIDALATRRDPFTWSDIKLDRSSSRLMRAAIDRAAEHGWTEGLAVPMPRGEGRVGLVSLVGSTAALTAEARAYLCLISLCLHTHVRSLVSKRGFAAPPMGLTPREVECIRLVAKGSTDAAVAKCLKIAASTAHEYIEKAKHKLKTRSRVEMVAVAVSLGIVDI